MYGIVNKAIQGLVTENFGEEKWELIKSKSGVNIDNFLSNDQYDDTVTFQLAGAASEVLGIPLKDVLIAFGKYWIAKTGQQHYGALMASGGKTFTDFLVNLPNFHSRVMLMYPNIVPPEFKVTDMEDSSLNLHYYSKREGLADFVEGLILGLGDAFKLKVYVELILSRDKGHDHEVYRVTW
jgi:Haem-NO-binding